MDKNEPCFTKVRFQAAERINSNRLFEMVAFKSIGKQKRESLSSKAGDAKIHRFALKFMIPISNKILLCFP